MIGIFDAVPWFLKKLLLSLILKEDNSLLTAEQVSLAIRFQSGYGSTGCTKRDSYIHSAVE
jgi:hypothetical protein